MKGDIPMSEVFQLVPASDKTLWVLGGIALLLIGLLCLFGCLAYSSRHTRFEISPEGLTISGGLHGRTISAESLVLEEAKRVDLSGDSEYRLRTRTNGTGLPGYQAGWFKLRNGEKALVFVTDLERVVYIPTTEGYSVLLSVAAPEKFLEALASAVAGR